MKISAKIKSDKNHHNVIVSSNGVKKVIDIPLKENGYGSSINGGEFLSLALATCFCNDIYREADKKKITIHKVEIDAFCEFSKEGIAGQNIKYKANIQGDATDKELKQLIKYTDTVVEIHNTLRKGVSVSLII